MRKTKILWCLLALLCLLAVATVAWRLNLWNIRGVQPSNLYLQYKDMPGIQASFIKDKQFNDSITISITLIQTEDSTAFASLIKSFGRSDEYVNDIITHIKDENTRYINLFPKGHPERARDNIKTNNDIMALFPAKKIVIIFHTETEEQLDAIEFANYFKIINI